ncbi:hypothetical protein COT95_02465 [Candidatus Falkowbacteria bacterium CG10_big_fil_rev_8_21_14_0_10_37_6]|uniref:DUF192 domain-containing protein n=1 Tax=Candidatus Falkowbacteria bacterium CG10_big_fil_rev_8_21_14_0_10_37_6 TaxID=1974563 RepID=A0A2H0V6M9_9BACT|nr:MAG: hypothetical protein COT95_02465 [Candidatus Falkowbacteria bacterium CG10_big_fil_rev_8_21_14_0_10_37_6]
MSKKIWWRPIASMGLSTFLIIFGSIALNKYTQADHSTGNIDKVCLGDQCFVVEIAQTPAERIYGLMHREYLDDKSGMFFIFDKSEEHNFWMKNTLIPLDIIWIGQDKKIVFISKNTLPCQTKYCPRIKPEVESRYVLEVNAGAVDKYNLKLGDLVIFR